MTATLNQDDIKLLKSVFVTKSDLAAMEKRQNAKFATKSDLSAMEKRQDAKYAAKDDLHKLETRLEKKITDAIENSENSIIQAVTTVEIELRGKIKRLEGVAGISATN